MTVHGGWTSHTTRGDGDYEARKLAAIEQSRQNEHIQGVQSMMVEGLGKKIKDGRDELGIVNVMPNQMIQGANNTFSQKDEPSNMPLFNPTRQTGSVDLQTSATKIPQQDPEQFETAALEKRLATMAKGGMHNLNSVPNLYPRRA